MSSPEWSKISSGLTCNNEILPDSILDAQSAFAVAYHSTTSIRARCIKNVGTLMGESSSYVAEAILSSKTSSGHQLLVRLVATQEGKVEISVCSGSPEGSPNPLVEYAERIRRSLERIGKLDEKERRRVVEAIKVEMKLDSALGKILSKAPVGDIYPTIGIIRETLIRVLEGFDPMHIETGASMETLHKHALDTPLDDEDSKLLCIKILDWKRRLSKIIDEMPLQQNEVQPKPETG
jgi:hypothetical protein